MEYLLCSVNKLRVMVFRVAKKKGMPEELENFIYSTCLDLYLWMGIHSR